MCVAAVAQSVANAGYHLGAAPQDRRSIVTSNSNVQRIIHPTMPILPPSPCIFPQCIVCAAAAGLKHLLSPEQIPPSDPRTGDRIPTWDSGAPPRLTITAPRQPTSLIRTPTLKSTPVGRVRCSDAVHMFGALSGESAAWLSSSDPARGCATWRNLRPNPGLPAAAGTTSRACLTRL